MSNNNSSKATRYLLQVAVATTLVAVLPVVIVWLLLFEGVVSSPWVCVALAIALSFTASIVGSSYWKRCSGPGDVLFSELLLWGWWYRFRSERRLANAVGLLGLGDGQDGGPEGAGSVERKAEVLRQMAAALDAQDPYTDGHSRRVALHSAMIARKMGLRRDEVARVRTAAAVHDVGKLTIPLEILNKPGTLTPAEFEIVKRHADEGAEIVSRMGDPEVSNMVRHHHERFDGAGYPAGMAGEQIPLGARIIAVADTFDALTSERPYRAAIRHKQAFEILLAVSGSQLDPVAVRAFVKCYAGKRAILFWTLVAVSPQRALAFLDGGSLGRTSLGPAATAAMPAALATLAVSAFGSAGGIAQGQNPLRFAQRPSAPAAAVPSSQPSAIRHAGAGHRSALTRRRLSPAKDSVLASTVTRSTSAGTSSQSSGGSSAPSPHGGSSGSSGVSGGRSGGGSGTGSGRGRGGGSRKGSGTVSAGVPVVHGSPPAGSGSSHPPVSSGGSSPPPTSSGPQNGGAGGNPGIGGNGGGSPGQGGTGSGPGGGTGGSGTGHGGGSGWGGGGGSGWGGGGSGSGRGGGSGSGGGGSGRGGGWGGGGRHGWPHSHQDCMDGGWLRFNFPNQGLCVAWLVQHVVH